MFINIYKLIVKTQLRKVKRKRQGTKNKIQTPTQDFTKQNKQPPKTHKQLTITTNN